MPRRPGRPGWRKVQWRRLDNTTYCSPSATASDADGRLAAYRQGVFATVKNHLSKAGQKLLPLVERAFYCLRSVPTALLFHTVAHVLLETLSAQAPSERKAAVALKKHYFQTCTNEEACSRYELTDWVGHPQTLLLADWWCGFMRIQPGSASGTVGHPGSGVLAPTQAQKVHGPQDRLGQFRTKPGKAHEFKPAELAGAAVALARCAQRAVSGPCSPV